MCLCIYFYSIFAWSRTKSPFSSFLHECIHFLVVFHPYQQGDIECISNSYIRVLGLSCNDRNMTRYLARCCPTFDNCGMIQLTSPNRFTGGPKNEQKCSMLTSFIIFTSTTCDNMMFYCLRWDEGSSFPLSNRVHTVKIRRRLVNVWISQFFFVYSMFLCMFHEEVIGIT